MISRRYDSRRYDADPIHFHFVKHKQQPTDAATAPEEAKDTDAEPLVTTGPAVELEPSRLEFHCLTGEKDTAVLTIRNTGSTLLFWELEELPPQKFFEETVPLPTVFVL